MSGLSRGMADSALHGRATDLGAPQVLLTGRLLRVLTPGLALAALPLTAAVLLVFIAARPSPALLAAAEIVRKVCMTQPPCAVAGLNCHVANFQGSPAALSGQRSADSTCVVADVPMCMRARACPHHRRSARQLTTRESTLPGRNSHLEAHGEPGGNAVADARKNSQIQHGTLWVGMTGRVVGAGWLPMGWRGLPGRCCSPWCLAGRSTVPRCACWAKRFAPRCCSPCRVRAQAADAVPACTVSGFWYRVCMSENSAFEYARAQLAFKTA